MHRVRAFYILGAAESNYVNIPEAVRFIDYFLVIIRRRDLSREQDLLEHRFQFLLQSGLNVLIYVQRSQGAAVTILSVRKPVMPIHTLPDVMEDPVVIEISCGQNAADGVRSAPVLNPVRRK
jgi:hypothetical protein